MVMNRHHALARDAILAALTAYTGVTTDNGATPVYNTLIDANLKGKNDFISGKTILIGSGDALYEDKGAASFDNTDGTITVESPFSARIKKGTLFRILNAASAGEVAELLDSLVSYRGTTTADGVAGGGTLVCSDLTTKPDFNGNQVVIKSGTYAGQVRDIDGVTTGGTVTPHTSFGGTITEGTRFSITAIRTVPAEVAAIEAKLDMRQGLVYYGKVTLAAVLPIPHFGVSSLIGFGDNYFKDFRAYVVRDAAGAGAAPQGETQTITGYGSLAGTFNHALFTVPLTVDDEVLILHPRIAEIKDLIDRLGTAADAAGTTTLFARLRQIVDNYLADGTIGLAVLKALIDATEAKLDKLAGEVPDVGTATEDWNTAEEDIVSIGADDTKNKLHSLVIDISALTATATISIRMYMQVNGVEKKVYDQDFVVGTDPDGLWIVNGTVGIHEVLRVTAQSDNAGDDGKAIAYDYMLEAM